MPADSVLPLSVFIIARDEADRIPAALASVQGWVDEIIVIDSGSLDATVAVSQLFGARTEYRAWTGYGEQKVYGESLCRNDWLLNIDADEAISPELGGNPHPVRDRHRCRGQRLPSAGAAALSIPDRRTSVDGLEPARAPVPQVARRL